MASYNRIVVIGNLVRDPSVKFLPSGTAACEVSLAINDRVKKGEVWQNEVSYLDVAVFGKRGEALAEHVGKGGSILVEGKIRQQRWEAEGKKKSRIVVIADNIVFLSASKKKSPAEEQAVSSGNDADYDPDIPF